MWCFLQLRPQWLRPTSWGAPRTPPGSLTPLCCQPCPHVSQPPSPTALLQHHQAGAPPCTLRTELGCSGGLCIQLCVLPGAHQMEKGSLCRCWASGGHRSWAHPHQPAPPRPSCPQRPTVGYRLPHPSSLPRHTPCKRETSPQTRGVSAVRPAWLPWTPLPDSGLPTGSPGTPTGPSRPWSPGAPASPWGGRRC